MSLNYQLPAPLTNASLHDDYPDLHENLFGICVTTMDVGVPKINGKWYDRIRQQIATYDTDNVVRPALHWGSDLERTLEFYAQVLTVLYGMTTNASTKTDKQFRAELKEG